MIQQERVLPFSEFETRSREAMHAVGYDDAVVDVLLDWSKCVAFMRDDEIYVNVNDAKHYIQNWGMTLQHTDPILLTQPRGLSVDKVVDVQEFAESREYLGQVGYVWKSSMEDLWGLFHSKTPHYYTEVIFGGAIGIGKTYKADIAIAYILYMLSCYHAPQVDFGLAPGSSIVFIMQSAKLALARQVLFGELGVLLRNSPYFKKAFPYNTKVLSELRFPNNISIIPVSSATTAALGMNVFGGVLDEANFLKRIRGGKSVQFTGESDFDQAQKLYTTLERRMKSRFHEHGKIPGKLFLLSSANYPGDFLDRRIQAAKRDDTIFVRTYSHWNAIPETRVSKEKFLVEVGDSSRKSRIVLDREDAIDPTSVIEVPIDYRKDFEDDIDSSIRDIAGIPVGARGQFIRQRDKLALAIDRHKALYGGKQMFVSDLVELSRVSNLRDLIDLSFFEMLPQGAIYAAHIDLSLTGDRAGLAFSRQDGVKQLDKRMVWNEGTRRYTEAPAGAVPIVSVDGILGINPPASGEIDLEAITTILLLVHSIVPVLWLTADTFQSASSIQRARKKRISAGRLSVDTTLAPYFELRHAIRDERLLMAPSDLAKEEILALNWDPNRQKIDHEPKALDSGIVINSKDLSDAIAGSLYTIVTRRSAYTEPVPERRRNWGRQKSALNIQGRRARQNREPGKDERLGLRKQLISARRRRVVI